MLWWTITEDRRGRDRPRTSTAVVLCLTSVLLVLGTANAQRSPSAPARDRVAIQERVGSQVGSVTAPSPSELVNDLDNDPLGDLLGVASGFDLRALRAIPDSDSLVLTLRFAEPLAQTPGLYGFVDLDLDRDGTTGGQPAVSLVATTEVELGSEAYVALDSLDVETGTVTVVTDEAAVGGASETSVPATVSGDELTIRLPPSLVPDAAGVHVAAAVGTESDPSDVAPNHGVVSSRSAAAEGEIPLRNGRFTVSAEWTKPTGERGIGRPVLSSDDSTLLWFFDPDNWEMVVKVLDGCGINDHYWVFTAASTTVQVTVTVTDLGSGLARVYRSTGGGPALPVADTEAFGSCP